MSTRLLLTLFVVSSLTACKAKPTPAQIALDAYVASAARSVYPEEALADGASVSGTQTGGEPVEGSVEAPHENMGVLEWVRTKLVKETVLPNGDHRVDLMVDLCMRAENSNGGCTRPNTYSYNAVMRNEGGTWKVAGATVALFNSVR